MRVNDVLQRKADDLIASLPDSALTGEAIEKLTARNIGALLILSGEGVAGILSERDVVRALTRHGDINRVPVSDLMTSPVRTCSPEDSLDDIMEIMTEQRIRHLPVLDRGELVGIVSIGDVVKHRMGELEFERDQLDLFVHTQAS